MRQVYVSSIQNQRFSSTKKSLEAYVSTLWWIYNNVFFPMHIPWYSYIKICVSNICAFRLS